VRRLSKELGVSQPTLSQWRKVCGKLVDMKKERSTTKLSLSEQYRVLCEYRILSSTEQGSFLRQHGLKSGDLERYEEAISEALNWHGTPSAVGRPSKSVEVKELEHKLAATQKDLRFKERALAETAARVVLLKKSRILFGLDDFEEN
jgi:transposase